MKKRNRFGGKNNIMFRAIRDVSRFKKKVEYFEDFESYVLEENAVVYPDYRYVLSMIKLADRDTRIFIGRILYKR